MEKAALFCVGGTDRDSTNTKLADLLKPRMQSVSHHCPKLMDGCTVAAAVTKQSRSPCADLAPAGILGDPITSGNLWVNVWMHPSHQHKLPVSTKH